MAQRLIELDVDPRCDGHGKKMEIVND